MKFENLADAKFQTLEKAQMSKICGGSMALPETTGGGTYVRMKDTPYETSYSYSSDSISDPASDGSTSTTYHLTGGPNDPATPNPA